jgi:hypothetical protein
MNSQLLLLTELRIRQLRYFIAGRLIWLSGLCLRLAKVLHGWD